MERHWEQHRRNSKERRPPPYGQPPPPATSTWQPYPTAARPRTPRQSHLSRRHRGGPRALPPGHQLSASPSPSRPAGSQGTRPGSQRGEPTASPHGRNHRDVATWTSQDGGDPPVSYVSSRPWRRQERARVGVAPAHLYRPFQGRTVEDADRRANGACLPVPAGTRFCECGAVVIHNSHELGKLHRHRTQATQPSSRESSQERSGAAVRAMLARAAQEADFAQWLLRVASGHASSESPPAPLSITATVERGAAGPGETLVAAALTPEVASMTLEAGERAVGAPAVPAADTERSEGMDRHWEQHRRNSKERRPPPYGQPPPPATSTWQPYPTAARPRTPRQSHLSRRHRGGPRALPPGHQLSASPSPSRPAGSQGTRPGSQRGEPTAIASRPQPPRRGNLDQPGWRRPSGVLRLLEALAPAGKGPSWGRPSAPVSPFSGAHGRGRGPEG
ncbi:hypothetical protein HPB51_013061 [Rhipicephalus microplus]|uniref:Uncharacterized protein n=1 Tax=Rhipicephalus microplus TaxID=6941 RepID=A0A9J6F2L5_RHIMP|nr:hypothetical protein HPB51_013061 [Rhipicephalus microplus]